MRLGPLEERVDLVDRLRDARHARRGRELADNVEVVPVVRRRVHDAARGDRAEDEVGVEHAHVRGARAAVGALRRAVSSIVGGTWKRRGGEPCGMVFIFIGGAGGGREQGAGLTP